MKVHTADYFISVGHWPSDMADPPTEHALTLFTLSIKLGGEAPLITDPPLSSSTIGKVAEE